MTDRLNERLINDLRRLVSELGTSGGAFSASIYDTAQVLRLAPPSSGAQPALEWLFEQQHEDGGWGNPAFPRARDVSSLAAVLAIYTLDRSPRGCKAVEDGLSFLRRQASLWEGPLPDDLPVGVELLLPALLQEAAELGLDLPLAHYSSLIELGRKRRRMVAAMQPRGANPAVHSWETWGVDENPALLDSYGSIGHSPAATAAWLRMTAHREDLAPQRAAARRYLDRASESIGKVTGESIPGVVPTAWPINRFEQSFALYAVLAAGLLDHPALQDVLKKQIADMARAMRPIGVGFSDEFETDGDDTVAAMAVMHAAGYVVDRSMHLRFMPHRDSDYYIGYIGELQPSISVTAHAIHLMELLGQDTSAFQQMIVEKQLADGRWLGDKWNCSWLYTTSQVLVAMAGGKHSDALKRAAELIVREQRADGSWGTRDSNLEEAAYAVIALRAVQDESWFGAEARAALERGERWMRQRYNGDMSNCGMLWIAKESYRPLRIARMFELVAMLPAQPSTGVAATRNVSIRTLVPMQHEYATVARVSAGQ
ncbi:MAG TPA: hypothetical protein VFS21_26395 [Roseiflexaceae bacterium]|nr:hypothetical protein [Roseiflexaceae bacterium]